MQQPIFQKLRMLLAWRSHLLAWIYLWSVHFSNIFRFYDAFQVVLHSLTSQTYIHRKCFISWILTLESHEKNLGSCSHLSCNSCSYVYFLFFLCVPCISLSLSIVSTWVLLSALNFLDKECTDEVVHALQLRKILNGEYCWTCPCSEHISLNLSLRIHFGYLRQNARPANHHRVVSVCLRISTFVFRTGTVWF